jgi:pimeloyl-ACP methyl ester carboxylesterase
MHDDTTLASMLAAEVVKLDLEAPEPPQPEEAVALRRSRRASALSGLAEVSLVRVDGVLRWTYARAPRRIGPRRARRASVALVGGEKIHSFRFQEVPPNRIVAGLETLDAKLTPNQGLRRWKDGKLEAVKDKLQTTPRVLLFIHGTFSKSDMFFDELAATNEGRKFLKDAEGHYRQILAFDHPTLSVSPLLNALDLERALGGYEGEIDVICHSRGGLVAAWWLRTGVRKARKVVFVASPLEGTSLAAPARLRDTLDALANIADALQKAAGVGTAVAPAAAPLLGIAAGLMQVVGGVLTVGARTPLLDAGVAVVAGLAAQSRVANNQELIRLHAHEWPSKPTCFAIMSDFEPRDPEEAWWQFWKKLRRPLARSADSTADYIFQGANDLVVDVVCMTGLFGTPIPAGNVCDFRTNNVVHHCNYFSQPRTVGFLAQKLL